MGREPRPDRPVPGREEGTQGDGHQIRRLGDAVKRERQHARAEAAGELFYDGTYRVGADVKPGTYAIEGQIENCYWERTDANGEIIDNNFVLGAARVQVTIAASDYSLTAQGCGGWSKVS